VASDQQLGQWRERALSVEEEVGKVVIGQRDTIRLINIALFARGHVLLEGDVGVGKTTILRAFSRAVGGDSSASKVVGAGCDEPSPIPKIDAEGNHHGFCRADEVLQSESAIDGATPGLEHFSALRAQHLQSLAQRLDLDYARLTDQKSLADAMQERRFARHRKAPTDVSWIAAAVALVLLTARFRPALR
jgi:hypothetical protein